MRPTPASTATTLYQTARAIVTAEIANVTYNEFLPHLLGDLAPGAWQGYDPTVDPRMAVEFAGAAYRFGHSTVSPRHREAGRVRRCRMASPTLRDAFFQSPDLFAADGGADGMLRHLSADLAQAMDARLVPDLRNFLFDPPVGIDLAAINIQRGRDLGLPHLNEMREALHLDALPRLRRDHRRCRHRGGAAGGLRVGRPGRSLDRRPGGSACCPAPSSARPSA